MSVTGGKEYKLAIKIMGQIDKSFGTSLSAASTTLKSQVGKLNSTFTQLDKYGNKAFNGLKTAATGAAVAIGTIEAASIKVGAEFEAQMSTVQAIAQASEEDLGKLSDKARDLAQTSVFSATEVGSAMEYMGLAGWKTEQMLDGIEGVLNLAAASGEDLATISDIVTDDLTAFGMKAEETQRMVDVMAATAMNSNTTVGMMGEAFKYAGSVAGTMGYKIEDLGVAVGTIASQGIKSSMAGTALRNMITRLVKPTKESSEAIEALGISLKNDKGEMNSFMDIMLQLREGMKKYDVDKQNYYAAELGGQRGMAAIAAIANSSEEDFNKLTEAIYHSYGAAEQMADVRLDNLKGDATIFKDTLTDIGIELYEQQDGPLRDIVQTGTKILEKLKKEIPAIGRSASKLLLPTFEKMISTGKWIIDNGDTIVSVLGGIATAILFFKGASTIVHFINFLMTTGPLGLAVVGVTALAGAIGGLVIKKKLLDKELKDKSLEEHFGTLTLSLKELKSVADALVKDDSFAKIEYSLKEYDKLKDIGDDLEDTASKLKKLNWKVKAGLELTAEENDSYKTYIDNYITNAQEYLTQAQYAAEFNLSDYFSEDSFMMQKLGVFFDTQREHLTSKAEELSKAVTDAFDDGFLDIDESKHIAELQQSMQNIFDKVSADKLEASTALIKAKYGSLADLDAESFMSMQDEINEAMEEYSELQDEKFTQAYSIAKEAGATASELDQLTKKHLDEMTAKQTEMTALMTGTILDAYSGSKNMELVDKLSSGEAIDIYDFEHLIDDTIMPQLDYHEMDAINELLENMKPQAEKLEALAESYREAGRTIPQSIIDGLNDYYKLELMSGNTEHMWEYIASIISENPEYASLLEQIQNGGASVPEELATAIEENQSAVDPAIAAMYTMTQKSINEAFADGFYVPFTLKYSNITVPVIEPKEEWKGVPYAVPDNNADGGIITNRELSWLAEEGPESVIPLDGSRNALSLWEKTGRLLGMPSAFKDTSIDAGTSNQVNYNPTLNFYGEAPSESDLRSALRNSQDEFESMLDEYFKRKSRFSFA